MMALGTRHKFTIFIFITLYLAETLCQKNIPPYDLKRNWKITPKNTSSYIKEIEPAIYPNPPVIYPPIKPCVLHSHVFSFSNVGLQKIGPNFIKSNDIISLSLDNNNISYISPFAFRNIQNLRHLNLSGNRIPKEKLLSLAKATNLEMLVIDNNRDFHDPKLDTMKEYDVFPNMRYLHLSNSQLRNFQVHFYLAMPILMHLYLNNNSIDSSEAVFENIPATLTHLYLNKNSIDRVKKDKLRHLQELNMDDNVITQICFEDCEDKSITLKNAFEMQNLSLSRNLISEIKVDAFADTRSLSILDLSDNKIADVAKGTFNNTSMIRVLSLANNILTTVPDVCPLSYMVNLDLSGNRISAITSDTFCGRLRTLEYLNLSNNVITAIETRAFHRLESLKYLDLSGNRLRQLPAQWIYSWLHELHLERNNFTELDHISLNNKAPNNIYLDENPMPILKAESFQSLPGHVRVHLKNIQVEEKCSGNCICENNEDDEDEDEDEDDENEY